VEFGATVTVALPDPDPEEGAALIQDTLEARPHEQEPEDAVTVTDTFPPPFARKMEAGERVTQEFTTCVNDPVLPS
jgi:hypothetical protein